MEDNYELEYILRVPGHPDPSCRDSYATMEKTKRFYAENDSEAFKVAKNFIDKSNSETIAKSRRTGMPRRIFHFGKVNRLERVVKEVVEKTEVEK